MRHPLVFALAALLLSSSVAPAQSYSSRPSGVPVMLDRPAVQGTLRREPVSSVDSTMQPLRSVGSPEFVKSGILASDEYFRRAGGTRADYVRRLYIDVLGRDPMPAEINYWVGRLRYEDRRDVAYRLLRFHPQNVTRVRPVLRTYDPGYFPDPASPTFCDPSGPYFRSPYFYNYEKSPSIRAFGLGDQG